MDPRDMTYKQLRRFMAQHGLKAKSRKRRALEAAVGRHQKRQKLMRQIGAPIDKAASKAFLAPLSIDPDGTPLTARRALPYRKPLPVSRQ